LRDQAVAVVAATARNMAEAAALPPVQELNPARYRN
jgi:hypothetical protein